MEAIATSLKAVPLVMAPATETSTSADAAKYANTRKEKRVVWNAKVKITGQPCRKYKA